MARYQIKSSILTNWCSPILTSPLQQISTSKDTPSPYYCPSTYWWLDFRLRQTRMVLVHWIRWNLYNRLSTVTNQQPVLFLTISCVTLIALYVPASVSYHLIFDWHWQFKIVIESNQGKYQHQVTTSAYYASTSRIYRWLDFWLRQMRMKFTELAVTGTIISQVSNVSVTCCFSRALTLRIVTYDSWAAYVKGTSVSAGCVLDVVLGFDHHHS